MEGGARQVFDESLVWGTAAGEGAAASCYREEVGRATQ
jgi:hypothetical protein